MKKMSPFTKMAFGILSLAIVELGILAYIDRKFGSNKISMRTDVFLLAFLHMLHLICTNQYNDWLGRFLALQIVQTLTILAVRHINLGAFLTVIFCRGVQMSWDQETVFRREDDIVTSETIASVRANTETT